MLNQISAHIKQTLTNFIQDDSLIFNNKVIPIHKENFSAINSTADTKKIAFIDGGQSIILSAANFCLSFIRVAAVCFEGNKKISHEKNEFYLFTRAVWRNDDLYYESKIFPLGEKIIDEQDLLISSKDASIRNGNERAPIVKITNMARRFAELVLASKTADFVLIDGTLEVTFPNEQKYLSKLNENSSSLAKSSSLFTTSGNSSVVLLNRIGPQGCWSYAVDEKTSFVKLHPGAKHVFRFEGNGSILPLLLGNSSDALFLGYPYGLILADKMARVSNEETKSLKMKFLLNRDNKEIIDYVSTQDAHDILDNLG